MKKLDVAEVQALSETLPAWRFDPRRGGTIAREYRFADFAQAFGFMAQIAIRAEKLNHHPEWFNVYDRVTITLTTHDVEGLSTNDLQLARLADRAYASMGYAQQLPGGSSCSDN